jgi:flagellar hook-basal body complex protein FliE
MEGINRLVGLENARAVEPAGAAAPAAGASFGTELRNAVASLEGLQVTADQRSQEAALGQGNLHETMLALEKADVSMRLATKVRNKLVEAYQEVMRMPV